MKFPYKAVLFDWAHTLVDLVKEDDHAAFVQLFAFMRDKGIALPDFDEVFDAYRDLFYGMIEISRETHREACFDLVLKHLLFRYHVDLSGKTTLEELLQVYYKEIYSCRLVYPDTVVTLKELMSRGVRMGIITNTTNPGFMKDYERKSMDLDSYFEFAIYSSEVPYRKPHTSIFRMAVNHMALDVSEILFVGDDLRADIEGAQGIGLATAWLNRQRKARKGNVRANHEIYALTDVLKLKSA